MCELDQKHFEEMVNVEKPAPNEVMTTDIILSDGFVSIIKKEDGTFALKDETTETESGRFLTLKEAEGTYHDFIRKK